NECTFKLFAVLGLCDVDARPDKNPTGHFFMLPGGREVPVILHTTSTLPRSAEHPTAKRSTSPRRTQHPAARAAHRPATPPAASYPRRATRGRARPAPCRERPAPCSEAPSTLPRSAQHLAAKRRAPCREARSTLPRNAEHPAAKAPSTVERSAEHPAASAP